MSLAAPAGNGAFVPRLTLSQTIPEYHAHFARDAIIALGLPRVARKMRLEARELIIVQPESIAIHQ